MAAALPGCLQALCELAAPSCCLQHPKEGRMHCWLLTSLSEQKSKCRWSREGHGGCTAALIPVQALGPGSEPALWLPLGPLLSSSRVSAGTWQKRPVGSGWWQCSWQGCPASKETGGSAVSVEDEHGGKPALPSWGGLYGGEGAAGKRFIRKQLEHVGVFRVYFDHAQQVCLCQTGLFTVSCNESHLLLKTSKINKYPGVA